LEIKLKVTFDSKRVYAVTLDNMDILSAKEAETAFNTISDLRKAGCNNVMYCLSFRLACSSPKDKKAVQKVGVNRVKRAYNYFAKELGV
jgi:hypothetical protein